MLRHVLEDDLRTFFEHRLRRGGDLDGGLSRQGVGRFHITLAAQGSRGSGQ